MESSYGIGINNRYALFLDAEDADPEIIQRTLANETKKSKGVEDKVNGVQAKKDALVKRSSTNNDSKPNNREDKENRGLDKRRAPQDRESRNNQRNDGATERSDESGRGRGRGGRVGRGGRGGQRTGKRDFDRKSGDDKTGIKPVEKRDGTGSHNWGTFKDDMQAEQDTVNTSADAEVTDPNVTDTTETTDPPPEAKEEEAKTLTLSEWKAQQQGQKDNAPKFNLRKAGEGAEIDPKWKKTYAYKKERETVEDEDDDEETEYYPQRAKPKKLLDIDVTFSDPSRTGRGGRGGRGGERGRGGGRGGERGRGGGGGAGAGGGAGGERGRGGGGGFNAVNGGGGDRRPRGSRVQAPNVNDELSFPSLG